MQKGLLVGIFLFLAIIENNGHAGPPQLGG